MFFNPWSLLNLSRTGLLLLLLLFVSSGLLSCAGTPGVERGGQTGNLLAGVSASKASGVSRVGRMNDGRMAVKGDDWRTHLTSFFRNRNAYVVYDLGQVTPLRAALLQGDANDFYVLHGSEDGETFRQLWTARPIRASGMQTRTVNNLDAQVRYLKVTAHGGDGRYSISEVAVFANVPNPFPPSMSTVKGKPVHEDAKTRMHLFGLVAIAFLLLNRRNAPLWIKVLGVIPVGFGAYLGVLLVELWPLDQPELTLLRAVLAAVAVVAVFRHYFPGKASQQDPRFTNVTLALLAVLAIGSYYHFGMPQFRDEAKGRQTLVHPWDMRVYFPIVKYFPELRFDGLYLASLAAYLDNNPNVAEASIAQVRLRDLNNNEMKVAGDVMEEIHAIRGRFSEERWALFRKDMQYFQDVMGAGGYLSSLRDHGGNATPVWIMGAYPFWAWSPASETTLSLTALLDPLLLILLLVVVGRTFGWRVAFIVAIVFGTTDLSRFGTNLMGSTLRLDWMVAIGLGACALHKKRWMTGGALLAYAGLIRGFPALATIFLVAPPTMWLIDWLRSKTRPPLWETFRKEQEPFLRATAGAVGCVVLLFALSSALFGYQTSWGNWFYKISIHQNKPNVNHVGLRNLLSYESDKTGNDVIRPELFEPWTDWQKHQLAAFERRKPLYYGGILLFTGLVFAASRRRQLHQGALMGLMMIPIYFYPANYYCHYVFLLPLLAADRKEPSSRLFGWVALVLLAMSVALYPTLSERQVDVRYTLQSQVILAGFFLVLAPMAYFAWRGWGGKLPAFAGPALLTEGPEPVAEKRKKKRKKKVMTESEEGLTESEEGVSESEEGMTESEEGVTESEESEGDSKRDG